MADDNQADDSAGQNDKDIQTQIKEAVEKETEGLKKKNDELMNELKSERNKRKELEQQAQEKEQQAAEKEGDVNKVKEQYEKKLEQERNKLNEQIEGYKGQVHKMVVDQGLQSALNQAGVAPQYQEAAHHLIKGKHQIEIEESDNGPTAKVDGKPLQDFISEWSQSDTGKNFVAAQNNSGGGAQGANGAGGSSGGKTMTRAQFDQLSHAERFKAANEGVQLTDE
jgi:signal recognition particle GTPase